MTHHKTTVLAAALALGLVTSACGAATEKAAATTPTTAVSPEAAPAGDTASLTSLVPAPADVQLTKGPDDIADGGIHLHYQVNGSPNDVMPGYKSALAANDWALTTIITSGGSEGGGATYTGTHGDAYGVFDGGGYAENTYIDVCAWPTKPADPNCSRGDR